MKDTYGLLAQGKVQWWNHGIDSPKTVLGERSNAVTYLACDVMARLVSGDVSYVPAYVGFLFGDPDYKTNPIFINPPTRLQDWNTLATEINGLESNILLAPVSSTLFSVDKSKYQDANYKGNVLSVSANTSTSGILALSGSGYKPSLEVGDKFYSVLLIVRRQDTGGVYQHIIFSRATLEKSGQFPDQLAELAFGVDWDITFY